MKKLKLDKEEKEILNSFERGEWKPAKNPKELERYRSYARAQLKKSERINIRLSQSDLNGIQEIAYKEGLPYQTLIASILHKYVTGLLRPS